MKKYDRFAAEQDLQAAWHVTDDLTTLAEGVLEHGLTPDQVANIVVGMVDLYTIRFNKVWDNFEASIAEDVQRAPLISPRVDELIQLRSLVTEFLLYLNITETNDEGQNPFHPNRITSCRTMDLSRMNEIINEMSELVNCSDL